MGNKNVAGISMKGTATGMKDHKEWRQHIRFDHQRRFFSRFGVPPKG